MESGRVKRAQPDTSVARRALDEIRQIFQEVLAGRTVRIFLFGSWARGDATPLSDIDVAIEAQPRLPGGTLARLRERLEESHVPYRVDVVVLDDVDPVLRRRILEEAVPWSA